MEVGNELETILERRTVLEAEHDPHAAIVAGGIDIGGLLDDRGDVGIRRNKRTQAIDLRARRGGLFPDGAGRVDGIDATGPTLEQDLAAPVVDLETIDHHLGHATTP